jgi:FkbM family methyltransferase
MKLLKAAKGIYSYRNFHNLISLTNFLKVILSEEKSIKIPLRNGLSLSFRTGNLSDLIVAQYVFLKNHHHPTHQLRPNPIIIDLGANIGFTINDFNLLYPSSRVIGVELDANNYNICLANTSSLKNVKVYHCGIWHENTIVRYDANLKNDAFSINNGTGLNLDSLKEVEAITMNELLKREKIELVDYLKVDIEGAEKEIFSAKDLEWLKKINSINIEVHHKEDSETIKNALVRHGFRIVNQNMHWSSIIGTKSGE